MDPCLRFTQHRSSMPGTQTGLSPEGEAAVAQAIGSFGSNLSQALIGAFGPKPAAGAGGTGQMDAATLALLLQAQQKQKSGLSQPSVGGLPLWAVLALVAGGGFLVWRLAK